MKHKYVGSCSQRAGIPTLIAIAPYGNRGHVFITKNLAKFYALSIHRINDKTARVRCRFNKSRPGEKRTCKVTLVLNVTHIFDKNDENFYALFNFKINGKPKICHSCKGYATEADAKLNTSSKEYNRLSIGQ